jgi:hypothetical protein
MAENARGESPSTERKRRVRGATKTFPISSFEDVLVLAKAIQEHGVDGELRRVTVFDRLNRSPESGHGRQLVTDSAKYELTSGSYGAEYLRLTEDGAKAVDPQMAPHERRKIEFELAVKRIEPFNALYERLRGKRVPAADVMKDQLVGVSEPDRAQCVTVFMENVRYVGLVQKQAGADRIISIEEALEESADEPPRREPSPEPVKTIQEPRKATPRTPAEPTVHIDINIHIDSSASSEQIDQVFASMARHLYGREP